MCEVGLETRNLVVGKTDSCPSARPQRGSPAFASVRHRFGVTMKTVRIVLLALLPWLEIRPRAAEPVLPLRTNDVIAFIGGANMVALAQSGHLETLLTLQHPHHKLRFRSLAWEGDTVFAQQRDVNYPDLVTQLKQVGATVAFVQFGEMESLAGEAGLTNYVTAYESLLERILAVAPRAILLRPPPILGGPSELDKPASPREIQVDQYVKALTEIVARRPSTVSLFPEMPNEVPGRPYSTHDLHLDELNVLFRLGRTPPSSHMNWTTEASRSLHSAIVEKNRLWFDYARPSNWAFLAGDRTEQAFSRDYHDRNIRAFAQEMQQFLPLIADAEKRIDELAAKAAAEKESTR